MKKQKEYVPLYLENLWNQSMGAYAYYSEMKNKSVGLLLAEIYDKNADKIFKAQFLISEAINR